jgi:flagellum-specific peptidoglycan hydrolase FlgJ
MDQIDLILDKTNGGLKVFQEYLGKTIAPGVKFKNPFYDDAKASKEAGYATSNIYVQECSKIIMSHHLQRYDAMAMTDY